ncbi:MAG: hypothetical protein KAS64_08695 [Spirochaetes bacterium]|nr:hypothetical protein [Spirochaetota bacterium]
MVIDIIREWDEDKLRRCLSFWLNKNEITKTTHSLEKIFSSEKRIKNILLGLDRNESRILKFLIDTDDEKSKNVLQECFKNKIDDIDNALSTLVSKGLITIMKNRAKLTDGLDKIYINEIVEKTIKFKKIIFRNSKNKHDLEIKRNLKLNSESYYKLCGDIMPESIALKYTDKQSQNISDGLIFIDDVFKKACLFRAADKKTGVRDRDYENNSLSDYTYIYIISVLIIYFRTKRITITKTGNLHNKDELKLTNNYKITKKDMLFILDWLINNQWLLISEGIIELSDNAKKWISMDLDEKVNKIKSEFKSEIEDSFKSRSSIKVLKVLNNLRSKYDMDTTNDYDELCRLFRNWLKNIKILWKFGCIEIFLKNGSIENIAINNSCVNKDIQKGSIIISGNMEFISYNPVSWQEIYLNAFTSMNIENDVFIGKITQSSIINGIKMGLSGDTFLTMIKSSSKDDVPQNVLFSIKEWIADFKIYKVDRKYIFKGDIDVIEILLIDPEVNEFIDERIAKDVLIFKTYDERKINAILEKHNIYLGYEKNEEI